MPSSLLVRSMEQIRWQRIWINRVCMQRPIHGNKSQNNRQRALDNFKANKRVCLCNGYCCTWNWYWWVITRNQFDLPNIPETYVHRIGRTGRAGLSGVALSFCDAEEKDYLRDIYSYAETDSCSRKSPFPDVEWCKCKPWEACGEERNHKKVFRNLFSFFIFFKDGKSYGRAKQSVNRNIHLRSID